MAATIIDDLMAPSPVTLSRHATIAEARRVLKDNAISAAPVIESDGGLVGIVTATDLAADQSPPDVPVSRIMSAGVFTVPLGERVALAARIMRRHRIHHVVVTDGQRICGIVSSLDLLKLVEEGFSGPPDGPAGRARRGGELRRSEIASREGGEG